MKFIDDKSKNLKWWNRNYFFVGTLIVVLANILFFVLFPGKAPVNVPVDTYSRWGDIFYFNPTFDAIFCSFGHSNWEHVLLNMLCFAIAGLYLERKKGSFGIIIYVILGAYFSGIAIATNHMGGTGLGFSGVNYFIYAIIIVDYLFSFRHEIRNKTNIILGGIILALMYLSMCFDGGITGFGFRWYPYDFMTNLGHYSSFVVGLVLALIIQTTRLLAAKQKIK